MDHIVPRSLRRSGSTPVHDEDSDAQNNLAAACAHCNRLKGNFTSGHDPLTGSAVGLFHPRRGAWDEHFAWSDDYLRLLPLSSVGGATIARLRMNDPLLRRQRKLLRDAGAAGPAP